MEWWFKSDGIDFFIVLGVDENSPEEDIESEIEYWMHQISAFDLPSEYKKGVMGAVRWMSALL